MRRLYQWLSAQTSFFRYDATVHGAGSTVRTQTTTVRREGILLLGNAPGSLDICPLCGNNLAPTPAEQARPRLIEGDNGITETGPNLTSS
jgi:hypothetical protein